MLFRKLSTRVTERMLAPHRHIRVMSRTEHQEQGVHRGDPALEKYTKEPLRPGTAVLLCHCRILVPYGTAVGSGSFNATVMFRTEHRWRQTNGVKPVWLTFAPAAPASIDA